MLQNIVDPSMPLKHRKLPVGVASHQFQDLEEQIGERRTNSIPSVTEIPETHVHQQNPNVAQTDLENSSSISVGSLEQPDGEPVVSTSSGSNVDTQVHPSEPNDGCSSASP